MLNLETIGSLDIKVFSLGLRRETKKSRLLLRSWSIMEAGFVGRESEEGVLIPS